MTSDLVILAREVIAQRARNDQITKEGRYGDVEAWNVDHVILLAQGYLDVRAEVEGLQRQIKHLTYFEIDDAAIDLLTDLLITRSAGTPLEAIAEDAATNIRQLQQQCARLRKELNEQKRKP